MTSDGPSRPFAPSGSPGPVEASAPGAEPEREVSWDGDAAVHLEDLVGDPSALPEAVAAEGVAIELVGPHLRVSGSVLMGYHHRLSDFINNHNGLIELHGATILRRNGDPTKVVTPSLWVNPDDVTLIGALADERVPEPGALVHLEKTPSSIIVVTPGHTLTGEVHLAAQAILAAFIESPDPRYIPMTDVRTRSLADRRVITRYPFALLNRRHIVAATALQPGMVRGRNVL